MPIAWQNMQRCKLKCILYKIFFFLIWFFLLSVFCSENICASCRVRYYCTIKLFFNDGDENFANDAHERSLRHSGTVRSDIIESLEKQEQNNNGAETCRELRDEHQHQVNTESQEEQSGANECCDARENESGSNNEHQGGGPNGGNIIEDMNFVGLSINANQEDGAYGGNGTERSGSTSRNSDDEAQNLSSGGSLDAEKNDFFYHPAESVKQWPRKTRSSLLSATHYVKCNVCGRSVQFFLTLSTSFSEDFVCSKKCSNAFEAKNFAWKYVY